MLWHAGFRLALGLGLVTALTACGAGESAPEVTPSVPAAATAALPAEQVMALQASLDQTRGEFGFPGAIAGVWTPQGTWIGTTGSAGGNSQRPPTPEDYTRVGSLTKTFTVMALLRLVDRGEVSLNDTIGQYVADVPNADTATLRDLAQMTSGIPNYSNTEEFALRWGADPYQVFTPEQLIDLVRDEGPNFPAGTQMEYSNSNTVLLGMVMERVTGDRMADIYQRELLKPLGMTSTSFPGDSPSLPEPHLDGLTIQGEPWEVPKDPTLWNPSWTFTAGAMISTLTDIRTWTVALGTGGGLISTQLQRERADSVDSQVPPNTPELTYAMGFFNDNGWWGHNGSIPGFTTYAVYNPTTQTSVVAMVNSDVYSATDPPEPPADAVAENLIATLG